MLGGPALHNATKGMFLVRQEGLCFSLEKYPHFVIDDSAGKSKFHGLVRVDLQCLEGCGCVGEDVFDSAI